MLPKISALHVFSRQEMETTITSLILAGYSLENRTPAAATMVRRKRLSPGWVLLGVLTVTIALWVYLVVYACQRDHLVQVVLEAPAPEVVDHPDAVLRWPLEAAPPTPALPQRGRG